MGVARKMFWLMIFCTASVTREAADGSVNAGPCWVNAAGVVMTPAVAKGDCIREYFLVMIFCMASVICEAGDRYIPEWWRLWVKAPGAVTRPMVARPRSPEGDCILREGLHRCLRL